MREGSNMATFARRRTAAAILVVAMVIGMSATGAWAQEYAGSTVTTGSSSGDEGGAVRALAPGVTINDGDVSNETGIGVVINGGTSAGAAPAGGTNASVVE
jgi:hypothetical protein